MFRRQNQAEPKFCADLGGTKYFLSQHDHVTTSKSFPYHQVFVTGGFSSHRAGDKCLVHEENHLLQLICGFLPPIVCPGP